MMFATVLIVSLAAVAPRLAQEIRRDREEEMIHRGAEYTRAVRRYYKKFGRFPAKIEDLENTNNIRFLRQRYTDPIDGKEFKLVHFGEVNMLKAEAIWNPYLLGGTSQASPNSATPAAPGAAAATSPLAGEIASPTGLNSDAAAPVPGDLSAIASPAATSATAAPSGVSGRTFGGGAIVGVVSESKQKSIREFNGKNHYNDWQFIYDPVRDRGGLPNAPYQPSPVTGPPQVQPSVPALSVSDSHARQSRSADAP